MFSGAKDSASSTVSKASTQASRQRIPRRPRQTRPLTRPRVRPRQRRTKRPISCRKFLVATRSPVRLTKRELMFSRRLTTCKQKQVVQYRMFRKKRTALQKMRKPNRCSDGENWRCGAKATEDVKSSADTVKAQARQTAGDVKSTVDDAKSDVEKAAGDPK